MSSLDIETRLIQDYLFYSTNKFKLLKEVSESKDLKKLSILVAMRAKKDEWGYLTKAANDLVRCAGLFPYLEEDSIVSLSSQMAKMYHSSTSRKEYLHRNQQAVLNKLLNNESIILSAPTSFGKTFIIEELLLSKRYDNVMIIVPTIALIEEMRRKAKKLDLPHERISFTNQNFGDKNLFILTQERAYEMFEEIKGNIKELDILIIDEFYKMDQSLLGKRIKDDNRSNILSLVYRKYSNISKQLYLLGPYLRSANGFDTKNHEPCFMLCDTNTTYQEFIDANAIEGDNRAQKVKGIILKEKESVLVYCSSPGMVKKLFDENLRDILPTSTENQDLINWISENISSNWYLVEALKTGIGVHHGRLPKFLAQEVIRRFEDGRIKILLCTSTIIEGVNTSAKSVIIYNNSTKFRGGYLTFMNIAGRAGRMFKHFSGKVYCFENFHNNKDLIDVNDPIGSDQEGDAVSLLNLVEDDHTLNAEQKKKIEEYRQSTTIPFELQKQNYYIDPEIQEKMVNLLKEKSVEGFNKIHTPQLSWEEIKTILQLIQELGYEVWKKVESTSPDKGCARGAIFITSYFHNGLVGLIKSANTKSIIDNKAIELAFSFIRNAMGYEMPRYIRALDRLIAHTYGTQYSGSLKPFANRLEFLNTEQIYVQLEELGLPISFSKDYKIRHDNLSMAVKHIRLLIPKLANFDKYIAEKFLESF